MCARVLKAGHMLIAMDNRRIMMPIFKTILIKHILRPGTKVIRLYGRKLRLFVIR